MQLNINLSFMNERTKLVIDYWRSNVESCADMSDAQILESILYFAIREEYSHINEYKSIYYKIDSVLSSRVVNETV